MIDGYKWHCAPAGSFESMWQGWGDFLGNGKRYKHDKSPGEWVPVAEMLAEENNGILPSTKWLRKNGYSGLPVVIRNNASLFAHIARHRHKTPSADHVKQAERLAVSHGGVLPCLRWIKKNYKTLAEAIRRHPEWFSHIKQEKRKSGHGGMIVSRWEAIYDAADPTRPIGARAFQEEGRAA